MAMAPELVKSYLWRKHTEEWHRASKCRHMAWDTWILRYKWCRRDWHIFSQIDRKGIRKREHKPTWQRCQRRWQVHFWSFLFVPFCRFDTVFGRGRAAGNRLTQKQRKAWNSVGGNRCSFWLRCLCWVRFFRNRFSSLSFYYVGYDVINSLFVGSEN